MYKIKIDNFSNKRVSFDFDGTLDDHFDLSTNHQKKELCNIVRSLKQSGIDVHIVTKRYGTKYPASGLGYEYRKVYDLANSLGIDLDHIHFTDREYKYKHLGSLNIDVHFDDDIHEMQLINKYLPNIITIHIEDMYWRDLVY